MTDIKEITKDEPKNIGGRPKEWTDDRIDELAETMLKWAEKTNSFALIQFCATHPVYPEKFSRLAKEKESFRQALMLTKAKLANRMIVNLNSKESNCHPVFFNKYIRVNDWLLDQSLKEQENVEGNELAKHVVKIINFADHKKQTDAE